MHTAQYHSSLVADISLIDAQYHDFSLKRHYHLDFHFGLITQGEQQFYYQGGKYRTGPGHIQIMAPDQVHDAQTLAKQGFKTKIFSLPASWLDSLGDELSGQKEIWFREHCIENHYLFNQLIRLHSLLNDPLAATLAKECHSLTLFSQLIAQYSVTTPLKVATIGRRSLYQLRDYLMDNLVHKISLQDLAQLCGLSPSQLLRQFKRSTGMTPYAWLARLRLEQALCLLKAGQKSTQVAHNVGFYDQPHFVNAFRQAYGLSPSQIK